MAKGKGMIQGDLCLVGKSTLSTGETRIGMQVFSNAGWIQGADYDDSTLSWMIGKWSEEVAIDRTGQGKLEWLFRDMEGPYQVFPCFILYRAEGDTIKIQEVVPLWYSDIQRGISAMLESAHKREHSG